MNRHIVRLSLIALLGVQLVVMVNPAVSQKSKRTPTSGLKSTNNFQLILQGPFVICEEADADDLLILAPNPSTIAHPHEDPGYSTALQDFKLPKGDYQLLNLPAGKMTFVNSDAELVQFKGTCPKKGYHVSLKVPKPPEVWRFWPVPAVVDKDCTSEIPPVSYSTEVVLRYPSVDLSKIEMSDGTNYWDPKVRAIGNEGSMVFTMRPKGDDPNHDPEAYAAMATMAQVQSCVHVYPLELHSHKQSIVKAPNEAKKLGDMYMTGGNHTDCHAPLMLLCKSCPLSAK